MQLRIYPKNRTSILKCHCEPVFGEAISQQDVHIVIREIASFAGKRSLAMTLLFFLGTIDYVR